MLELVIDPVVFGTPRHGDLAKWGTTIQRISTLAAHPFLRASSAENALNSMVSTWYSAPETSDGPATYELARFAHETAARLAISPDCPLGAPILDNITLNPEYVAALLGSSSRSDFELHLGEAACVQRDGEVHVGILGPADSWKEDRPQVLVEAEILARDSPATDLTEAEGSEALLREFLDRSGSVGEVLTKCCAHPCALLADPDFGVRAVWATQFGGDPWSLDFEIGPDFVASTKALNFDRRAGEARRCLRVMALIAGGRAAEVDGHDDRETEAATSPIRKDKSGNTVVRSRLQNRVPDADRLFWARATKPIFLNVAGHQGGPAL